MLYRQGKMLIWPLIRKNEDLLKSLGLGAASETKTLASASNLKTAENKREYDDILAAKRSTQRNRPGFPRKQPTEDCEVVPQSAIKRRRSVRLGGREKPDYTNGQIIFNNDRDTLHTLLRHTESAHIHPESDGQDIRPAKARKLGVRIHNPWILICISPEEWNWMLMITKKEVRSYSRGRSR